MHARKPQPNDVEAVINYIDPDAPTGTQNDIEREKSTLALIPHTMVVHDVRAEQARLGLETTGFVWLDRPTAVTDASDPAQLEKVCYPEAAALVQELTGADKVVVFGKVERDGALQRSSHRPVYNAHVDYDVPTIRAVARRLLDPQEAEQRLQGRIVLINLWRPLETVGRSPLAVCDASTVKREDLVYGAIGGKAASGGPFGSSKAVCAPHCTRCSSVSQSLNTRISSGVIRGSQHQRCPGLWERFQPAELGTPVAALPPIAP